MAKKRSYSPPVKTKASPRIARPPSIKSSLRAHPRLVHGFLVQLTKRSTAASGETNTAFAGKASGKVQTELPFDTKHEGPADDATFH